jgi:hypothetical protein
MYWGVRRLINNVNMTLDNVNNYLSSDHSVKPELRRMERSVHFGGLCTGLMTIATCLIGLISLKKGEQRDRVFPIHHLDCLPKEQKLELTKIPKRRRYREHSNVVRECPLNRDWHMPQFPTFECDNIVRECPGLNKRAHCDDDDLPLPFFDPSYKIVDGRRVYSHCNENVVGGNRVFAGLGNKTCALVKPVEQNRVYGQNWFNGVPYNMPSEFEPTKVVSPYMIALNYLRRYCTKENIEKMCVVMTPLIPVLVPHVMRLMKDKPRLFNIFRNIRNLVPGLREREREQEQELVCSPWMTIGDLPDCLKEKVQDVPSVQKTNVAYKPTVRFGQEQKNDCSLPTLEVDQGNGKFFKLRHAQFASCPSCPDDHKREQVKSQINFFNGFRPRCEAESRREAEDRCDEEFGEKFDEKLNKFLNEDGNRHLAEFWSNLGEEERKQFKKQFEKCIRDVKEGRTTGLEVMLSFLDGRGKEKCDSERKWDSVYESDNDSDVNSTESEGDKVETIKSVMERLYSVGRHAKETEQSKNVIERVLNEFDQEEKVLDRCNHEEQSNEGCN